MPKNRKYWKRRLGAFAAALEDYVHHIDLRPLPELDNEGLALVLEGVKGVTMLDLNETAITNEGIGILTRLEYITELRLKACDIDDDCIDYLNGIAGLRFLHLRFTGITIDGLLQADRLAGLETLMFSSTTGADFPQKMRQLQKKHPGCRLVVDAVPYEPGDEAV